MERIYLASYLFYSLYCTVMPSGFVQHYVRLIILPLSQQVTYISSVNTTDYVSAFACLHFALADTWVLSFIEELCITKMSSVNSFAKVLNPWKGSVYIIIHRQTLSLYHNFSVWLVWNSHKFTLGELKTWTTNNSFTNNIYIYIYIYIYI